MDAVWLLSNEICRRKYISPRLDIDPRGSKSIEWHRAMIAAAAALRPQNFHFQEPLSMMEKTQFYSCCRTPAISYRSRNGAPSPMTMFTLIYYCLLAIMTRTLMSAQKGYESIIDKRRFIVPWATTRSANEWSCFIGTSFCTTTQFHLVAINSLSRQLLGIN